MVACRAEFCLCPPMDTRKPFYASSRLTLFFPLDLPFSIAFLFFPLRDVVFLGIGLTFKPLGIPNPFPDVLFFFPTQWRVPSVLIAVLETLDLGLTRTIQSPLLFVI